MRTILAIVFALTTTTAVAQLSPERVEKLEKAIAHAEGFDQKETIPNRYHNPGDLKSRPGIAKLPGQVRIGKAGHIVFRTDADGWSALEAYIVKLNEKHGEATLRQIAQRYAQNWRPWLKIVTKSLGVDPSTPLGVYLEPDKEATDGTAEATRRMPGRHSAELYRNRVSAVGCAGHWHGQNGGNQQYLSEDAAPAAG